MAKKTQFQINYPTEQVFAAAVHAYNENQGYSSSYCSEPIRDDEDRIIGTKETFRNSDLTQKYLKEGVEFSEECYAEARKIISYYGEKLLDLMAGKLNSYSQSALFVAQAESITNLQQIGLIASLPKAYKQSINFDNMLEAKTLAQKNSAHFGAVGDTYQGRIEIISSVYSIKWFRHFHTAKDLTTKNVVNFSSDQPLEIGRKMQIRGRIKDHVDGNVTRLNYVKLTLDETK
jgi:hypothetical protein